MKHKTILNAAAAYLQNTRRMHFEPLSTVAVSGLKEIPMQQKCADVSAVKEVAFSAEERSSLEWKGVLW